MTGFAEKPTVGMPVVVSAIVFVVIWWRCLFGWLVFIAVIFTFVWHCELTELSFENS